MIIMANGDDKGTTSEEQNNKGLDNTILKNRAQGPRGRALPTRRPRDHKPNPSKPNAPVDELTLKQLEFLQNIHEAIKNKEWQVGKLGGMDVVIGNQTKLMPHNAARIYNLSSKADGHNLSGVRTLFMEVSQILVETQKEPWWKKVLDKLDFLNLFARSKDTSEFYKKSHDTFFNAGTKSKGTEEPDPEHSADSVKGLPPHS